jgi:hypothetical protein
MNKIYRRPRRLTRAEKILVSKRGHDPKHLLVTAESKFKLTLIHVYGGSPVTIEK